MKQLKKSIRLSVKERLRDLLESDHFDPISATDGIRARLFSFDPLLQARSVMIYLNLPNELPTFPLINDLFFRGLPPEEVRSIAVPWCDNENLRLFRLRVPERSDRTLCYFDLPQFRADFEKGAYGIWEPKRSLRSDPDREISPEDLDLILVPGLAFDRKKNRLGRGAGFYDRFFKNVLSDTILAALAFDEQILNEVPTEPHDRSMDYIFTPSMFF